MKRIVAFVVIVLPLVAQDEARYSQIMKDIASASGQVKKALDARNSRQDVADGGAKLVKLFQEVEGFWTKRGTTGAIEIARKAVEASKELADPQSVAAAQAALGNLNATCAACHAAHREKTEGGFKIKP